MNDLRQQKKSLFTGLLSLVSAIREVTETTQTNQQDIRTGLTNS
jgi:hypothetical protein